MTDALVLCGHPPDAEGFEPCPLEKGHRGEHLCWMQTARSGKSRMKNAVWIYGEDGQAVMHADFTGHVDAEEVCALLALAQAASERGGR